jgi:Sap, sulfolipid-1-addressing protein
MGTIFVLGLAAALYPQLLAVVVVILTRPNPKPLLWACYLGSLVVSVGCSAAILAVFRSRGSVAGTSSHSLGPATYMVVGGIALVLATFAATQRGRELLGGDLSRARWRKQDKQDASGSVQRVRSKAERALKQGSLRVAAAVGGMLGVPGPFDLVALGHMARGSYTTIAVSVMIVAFNLIKFLAIEMPIVSYAISPERTAAWIDRFSSWMQIHKIDVIAAVVGLISVVLIGRGISGLS